MKCTLSLLVLWWHKHWSVFLLSYHTIKPGPVFYLLVGVISGYAQPITGQGTEVTCPVIGQAQPELTQSKRQKTGPDMVVIRVMASFHEMYPVSPRVLWWHKHWSIFLLSCHTITRDMVVITVMASFHEMYPVSPHVLWWYKHWGVFLLSCYTITRDMVVITVMASFHELYPVSPHVLWWHKHWGVFLLSCYTITRDMVVITVMASFHEMYSESPCTLMA